MCLHIETIGVWIFKAIAAYCFTMLCVCFSIINVMYILVTDASI